MKFHEYERLIECLSDAYISIWRPRVKIHSKANKKHMFVCSVFIRDFSFIYTISLWSYLDYFR